MTGELETCFYGSTSDTALRERLSNVVVERRPASRDQNRTVAERPKRLSDAAVLTFDGYGTLVDRESGIVAAIMPWLRDVGVTAGRGEIIRAFTQAERACLTPGIPYRDVLMMVHDMVAEFFGVAPDRDAARAFSGSIGQWPIHPDAAAALNYLKQHVQLVVLTNADHASFAITNEALGVEFDAVYTAEDAGSYKPGTGPFSYLLDRLDEAGIGKHQILHVAGSIRFDHVPAKRLGMTTCWIQRKHGEQRMAKVRRLGIDVHPDFRFSTLGALADAHWLEAGRV